MFHQKNNLTMRSAPELKAESEIETGVAISEFLRLLFRQRLIIGAVTALFCVPALLYILLAVPRYTASALVLIEPQIARQLQSRPLTHETSVENQVVDSQVEIAQSSEVALKVIADLNLVESPLFITADRSWFEWLVSTTAAELADWTPKIPSGSDWRDRLATIFTRGLGPGETSADQQRAQVLQSFRRNLDVRRVALTHVIRISFTTPDPSEAERIANSVALTYVTNELRAKYESAALARKWLDAAIGELRQQAHSAEVAVQRFRMENSLAAGEAQVQLRLLEQEARASQAVYDSFLMRGKEIMQQQSFPVTEARIIARAERPLYTSYPPARITLGAAACLGLLAGMGAGLAREHADRTFRTSHRAERATGLTCLGVLPRVSKAQGGPATKPQARGRPVSKSREYARQMPFAPFGVAIRRALVALDTARLENRVRVLGIVGAVPNEGATTTASNLAQAAAMSGQKVIVIHADFNSSCENNDVDEPVRLGLGSVLRDDTPIEEVLLHESGLLSIIPHDAQRPANTVDLLRSSKMKGLLDCFAEHHDLVIVDLAPLSSAVDAIAIAPLIDRFLLVIECGRTPRATISRVLASSDLIYQRTIGFILNKADNRAIREFDWDEA